MVQAQVYPKAQYVSRADAKKVFSACKTGNGPDALMGLTMKVAQKTGKGNLPINEISQKTQQVEQNVQIYGTLKPTSAKKTAYVAGLVATAAIAAPVMVRAVDYASYYVPIFPYGAGIGVTVLAAAYGVYKAASHLITSWKNETRNSLDKLAYEIEQAILKNLQ
ncbi:MAG: hypothetical protein V1728_03215 [Candidatus Micrarchaeota archaeon]